MKLSKIAYRYQNAPARARYLSDHHALRRQRRAGQEYWPFDIGRELLAAERATGISCKLAEQVRARRGFDY